MTEKIEWYREVLELEPNSKVFFPLSRLLAEDGQTQEALTTLESGLERHPEFLEARLYLIELLHKYGFTEQCAAQVDRLSKMFASYAGFWRAWAACLSSEKEADTASVLRFLAAQFVAGPIQLHDVLNRGLETFMAETMPKMEAQMPAEPSSPDMAAAAQPLANDISVEPVNQAVEAALPELPEELPATENFEQEIAPADTAAEPVMQEADELENMEQPSGEMPEFQAEAAQPADAELPETMADESYALLGEEAGMVAEKLAEQELPLIEDSPLETVAPEEAGQGGEDADATLAAAVADVVGAAATDGLEPGMDAISEDLPVAEDQAAPAAATPDGADELEAAGVLSENQAENPAEEISGIAAAPETDNMPQQPAPRMANAGEESLLSVQSAIDDLDLPGMEEMEAALPEPDLELEAQELPAVEEAGEESGVLLETPAQAEPQAEDGAETADGGDSNEPFSLRTRSMAEVLAEQGDIQGALDIYHELAATAASEDEIEDINRRIATLEGKLGFAQPVREEFVEPEHSSPSRDKLIGMLEALANRVEARAHS